MSRTRSELPPCEAYGVYNDLSAETEDHAKARINRVYAAVKPLDPDLQTYVLHEGGPHGGLHFQPTPIPFNHLGVLDGAKLIWACQAADWEYAMGLYHEFMGWEPYVPLEG